LLPVEAYSYYQEAFPSCATWLSLPEDPEPLDTGETYPVLTKASTSIEPGKALARLSALREWAAEAEALARQCGLPHISNQFHQLGLRTRQPVLTTAFLGERKRGKTTVINRLIDADVLPVSSFDTLPAITSISGGQTLDMTYQETDGTIRPFSPQHWDDLQSSDALVSVRIVLPNVWLMESRIEIVDTPGIGDLSGPTAGQVFDILGQCDVAILTVSAVSPFSLTEAAFVQHELVGRRIPRIFVLLTNLDRVEEGQRQTVFRVAVNRIHQSFPQPAVLAAHSLEADGDNDSILKGLREQFTTLAAYSERAVLLAEQIEAMLTTQLDNLIASREASRVAEVLPVPIDSADRGEYEAQFDARRETSDQAFAEIVMQSDLVKLMAKDWQHSGRTSAWVKSELSFSLHRALAAFSVTYQAPILEGVVADVRWLESVVSGSAVTDVSVSLKIGQPADMVVSYLTSGPSAIAAGISMNNVGRNWLKGDSSEAVPGYGTPEAAVLLRNTAEIALQEYSRQVARRRHALYRQLFAQAWDERLAWYEAQAAPPSQDGQTVAARADEIKQQLEKG